MPVKTCRDHLQYHGYMILLYAWSLCTLYGCNDPHWISGIPTVLLCGTTGFPHVETKGSLVDMRPHGHDGDYGNPNRSPDYNYSFTWKTSRRQGHLVYTDWRIFINILTPFPHSCHRLDRKFPEPTTQGHLETAVHVRRLICLQTYWFLYYSAMLIFYVYCIAFS